MAMVSRYRWRWRVQQQHHLALRRQARPKENQLAVESLYQVMPALSKVGHRAAAPVVCRIRGEDSRAQCCQVAAPPTHPSDWVWPTVLLPGWTERVEAVEHRPGLGLGLDLDLDLGLGLGLGLGLDLDLLE